jgi:hypothetical protein
MHPLDDIRFKVDRAREHIDSLDQFIDSFLLEKPYGGTREHNTNTSEYLFDFWVKKLPDDAWGVVVGDIAHNLRSALDHIAYFVSGRSRGTGFPIYQKPMSKATFRMKVTRKRLRGAPKSAIDTAESLQPYHSPIWPEVGLLEVLRVLNNRDKHIVVTPALISPRAEIPGRSVERFAALKHGDRITVRFPPGERPHGKFFAEVAFEVPGIDPVTIRNLKAMHEFVRDEVVPKFANFL